jgi:hypothetical protein
LQGILFSAKKETCETYALSHGIIIAYGLHDSAYEEAVQDLINSVKSENPLEAQHGCLLATVHVLGRKFSVMKKVIYWSTFLQMLFTKEELRQ